MTAAAGHHRPQAFQHSIGKLQKKQNIKNKNSYDSYTLTASVTYDVSYRLGLSSSLINILRPPRMGISHDVTLHTFTCTLQLPFHHHTTSKHHLQIKKNEDLSTPLLSDIQKSTLPQLTVKIEHLRHAEGILPLTAVQMIKSMFVRYNIKDPT